jgi:hypothetical protein
MPATTTTRTRKPKPIDPKIVAAILKRGYVLSTEVTAVYGTDKKPSPHYTKRSIRRNPSDMSENIWMIPLAKDVYVFANNALTFYPNYSWGALCFFTGDQYNHKKTEAHLKKIYEAYFADYTKAREEKVKLN